MSSDELWCQGKGDKDVQRIQDDDAKDDAIDDAELNSLEWIRGSG